MLLKKRKKIIARDAKSSGIDRRHVVLRFFDRAGCRSKNQVKVFVLRLKEISDIGD